MFFGFPWPGRLPATGCRLGRDWRGTGRTGCDTGGSDVSPTGYSLAIIAAASCSRSM
jgi:hypothetical protein